MLLNREAEDNVNVAVIGAGSWGTALAQVAACNEHAARLWARRDDVACGINEQHRNPDYLKDAQLSESIVASSSLPDVVEGADAIVVVVPSKFLRSTANLLQAVDVPPSVPVVICTKGVEGETGMVPVQIFEDVIGEPGRLAALSGPNHAEEIVRGVPGIGAYACRLLCHGDRPQRIYGLAVLCQKNVSCYLLRSGRVRLY